MTAQELVSHQMTESHRMVRRAIADLSDDQADTALDGLMSPRQQIEHLCAVYQACRELAKGEPPAWGRYEVRSKTWTDLILEFEGLRVEAEQLLSGADDQSILHASEYLVAHDHYHVGQLCAIRLALEPQWDPYAIYS